MLDEVRLPSLSPSTHASLVAALMSAPEADDKSAREEVLRYLFHAEEGNTGYIEFLKMVDAAKDDNY